MTENEATREMTFDEEYEILQKEKEELFAMENCDSEPPFANCVVRRASRCIRKLLEEIQQYRVIGTIEEFKALKEKNEPKKLVYKDHTNCCPTCDYHYDRSGREWIGKNCPTCGQSILRN